MEKTASAILEKPQAPVKIEVSASPGVAVTSSEGMEAEAAQNITHNLNKIGINIHPNQVSAEGEARQVLTKITHDESIQAKAVDIGHDLARNIRQMIEGSHNVNIARDSKFGQKETYQRALGRDKPSVIRNILSFIKGK